MILVTGGLGMIGAHTARALLDLGQEVLGERYYVSDIVHLAGTIPGDDDPVAYFRTDTTGLLNALDAARA